MKKRNIIAVFPALACLALLPIAQAAPAPETPDPGAVGGTFNTADGDRAMPFVTGLANSAFGAFAGFSTTANNFNTAVGAGALDLNTADNNTAVGATALLLNTIGTDNVAVGASAMQNNTDGDSHTGVGVFALFSQVGGLGNTAVGAFALEVNSSSGNAAFGYHSLDSCTGGLNTAFGADTMVNATTGDENVALGFASGNGITTGSNIITIGPVNGVSGALGEVDNSCYIGNAFGQPADPGTITILGIDTDGKLGTVASSRRFKKEIKPMDKASEVILALKPVTFQYNYDKKNRPTPQFGLIAEEVAEVNPDLVVRDKNGELMTVRYEQINAMLLNEFLKEHKKVEEQQASISQLKSEMQTMVAQLKEQAAQIQKVSAQVEVNKPAPRVVVNKP
jgi:hypothetical protein